MGPDLPPDLVRQRQTKLKASSDRKSRSSDIIHADVVTPSAEQSSSEEEDEEVGPMLPGDNKNSEKYNKASFIMSHATPEACQKVTSGRLDWMLVPPPSNDWAKNIDTTKLKSRGFTTVRPGRPKLTTPIENDSKWLATPAQPSASRPEPVNESKRKITAPCVDSHKEDQNYRESLYDQHNKKRRILGTDLDDDVSSRPFDREKDIGSTFTRKHAHQMATKSKALSSMFDNAKYL